MVNKERKYSAIKLSAETEKKFDNLFGHSLEIGHVEQFFFHSDHLGSSNYITNYDGNITQHSEYLPFGELLVDEHRNSHNTRYKFNGKEFDQETGNYYYGARYYDPKTSLWLSVDPLAEKYNEWSPYNYTLNNPVKYVDPLGLSPNKPCDTGDCNESLKNVFPGHQGVLKNNIYGPFGNDNLKIKDGQRTNDTEKANKFLHDINVFFKEFAKKNAQIKFNRKFKTRINVYYQETVYLNTDYSRPFDDTSGDRFSERGFHGNFILGEEDIPIYLYYKTGNKMNNVKYSKGRTTYNYGDDLGKGTGYPINMLYNGKLVGTIFLKSFKERKKIIKKFYEKRKDFYFNQYKEKIKK